MVLSATIHKLNFPPREDVAPPVPTVAPQEATLPTASSIDEMLDELRRAGVRRIYGTFDSAAWETTCSAVGLFRLQLSGHTMAHMASFFANGLEDWAADWMCGGDSPSARAWSAMAQKDRVELLSIIFPGGDTTSGYTPLVVDFPRPFASRGLLSWIRNRPGGDGELMKNMHRASLAGLDVRVAAPGRAISIPKLDQWRAAATLANDPIVYGTHDATSRVVVLGSYARSRHDPVELRSLYELLDEMKMDL